jgi:DNA-binding winged helix-turn-helix (wHTH) protein/tetratricopeptide (TPR) repeat protein
MSFKKSPCFVLDLSESDLKGGERQFYEFKSFRLDVAERQLLHGNSPIPLTPKAFDVLALLVEHSGHLVARDELLKTVWANSFVEEQNITRVIHTLRRALGEDENGDKFIETVARKGYRFVADVTEVREPEKPTQENGNGRTPVAGTERLYPDPVEPADASERVQSASTNTLPAASVRSPEPKHASRVVLFTVGFLTAVSLLVMLSFDFRSDSLESGNKVTSIAVLPIRPVNSAQRDEVYEMGIAESLINTLGPTKGLIVRPLSATRQYSDIAQDPLAAGREQKVDFVLESNYQIAEGRIRITSQLFNVATGQIDATYKSESEAAYLFPMQDAVAGEIGGKLIALFGATVTGAQAKRGTTNEEAYRLYLQGAALTDKRDRNLFPKAIEYFEQAVRLDPNYALAYAKLANAHAAIVQNAGDRGEQYPKAKAAIEKALAIDDNLSDAHAYSGEIKETFEWDFAGAERAHKRSIELDPNSSTAHRLYAHYLSDVERHDEALAEIKIAVDLEPASALNHQYFGNILLYARRYDEAIAVLERVAEMDGGRLHAHNRLSDAYRYKGDHDRAFESFVNARIVAGALPDELDLWKTIYARSGWKGILERQLESAMAAEKEGKPNYNRLGWLASELGKVDEAFAYLEKSFAERGVGLALLIAHPRYDPLRGDPRFDDLVRRVGLK